MRIVRLPGVRPWRAVRATCVATLCLLAAGCLALPERRFAGPDPSDPKARVPAAAFRSTMGEYTSQRPVDPAPWRRQNERVTPAEKR
jgi:hypothetical protein